MFTLTPGWYEILSALLHYSHIINRTKIGHIDCRLDNMSGDVVRASRACWMSPSRKYRAPDIFSLNEILGFRLRFSGFTPMKTSPSPGSLLMQCETTHTQERTT